MLLISPAVSSFPVFSFPMSTALSAIILASDPKVILVFASKATVPAVLVIALVAANVVPASTSILPDAVTKPSKLIDSPALNAILLATLATISPL